MYIETVPNRNSPPCILLRESFRLDGKVKHRTVANLTNWPASIVAGLRLLLKGHSPSVSSSPQNLRITRSLPHGHVVAALLALRKVGLVVSPKKPSTSAARKARTKKTVDGAPVHSFQTLLADLATLVRNTIQPNLEGAPSWQQETEPTPIQRRALDLLSQIQNP